MRRGAAFVLRRVAAVAVVLAAYGWMDRLRGLPGPGVPLALPLREAGHQAAVPLVGVLVLWPLAFLLVAGLVPPRRPAPAAALRALAALGGLLVLQAVSMQLVRQATLGFDWRAALASVLPWLVAACAAAATLAAPRLRSRSDPAPS